MKKQLLIAVLLGALSTSAFAYNHGNKGGESCDIKDKKSFYKHGKKQRGIGSLMMALSSLELTDKQWIEIKKLMLKMKESKLENYKDRSLKNYFTDNGDFNKENYVKDRLDGSKSKYNAQANFIEKVEKLLTKEQKSQLKAKLEEGPTRGNKGSKKGCK